MHVANLVNQAPDISLVQKELNRKVNIQLIEYSTIQMNANVTLLHV